jgi:4-amino-4-deoxy-L-arabinose transferase-like glycosyltransferase
MAHGSTPASATTNGARHWFRTWWARARTSFFWMIIIALILRLGVIIVGHTYKLKTLDDNFSFGFEMGRIGRSLAEGHGFSSPFSGETGPTAWEPPLYPFLIAGTFNVFGVYTRASAFALLSINSLFSALTCIPIFLIARRCFSERVAVWSVWTWALLPNVIFWCTRWVWETSLAAFLLAMIFFLTLVMEEREGIRPWIYCGLLWGGSALINTSLLSFLPASALWIWYRRAKLGRRSVAGIGLASVVFVACLVPWLIRNERVFERFVFVRSNFGAELRLGNGPGADGTWMDAVHPTKNVVQLQLYRQMGELAYVAERKRQAVSYIREDYGRFARLCLRRFLYYWDGLPAPTGSGLVGVLKNSLFLASTVLALWGLARAIRQRRPGAWLFFWLIVCYPMVYYVTFPHPRYRHPIEPELGILILYVISEAKPKRN